MDYKWLMVFATALAATASCLTAFAARQPFERYQSIVDRQMFGQPPPGFDPTKSPSEVSAKEAREQEQELTKEQEQVKSAVHFSVINVTPAGDTAVGFTDNSDSKSPKHYYLKVGETRDGWTVKEADALAATMTIAKGDIEVSLTLGGNSASGGATAKAGGTPNAVAGAAAGRSSLLGGRMGGGTGRGLGSIRERRALREQQRAAEAQAAAEKEAQREQERVAEKARQEQEKAQREQEREEQRAQLMQIQEELRKAREERAKAEETKQEEDAGAKEGNGES